jgi:hypothetical protein
MVASDHCGEPIQTAPLGFRRSLEPPHTLEVDPATIGIAVYWRAPSGSHHYRMTAAPSRNTRARSISETWDQEGLSYPAEPLLSRRLPVTGTPGVILSSCRKAKR